MAARGRAGADFLPLLQGRGAGHPFSQPWLLPAPGRWFYKPQTPQLYSFLLRITASGRRPPLVRGAGPRPLW